MNFKFRHLQTLSIATATLAMTVLPSFNAFTFFGLTGAATCIVLVTSCKSEEPEPVKPEPEPNPDEPKPEPQRAEVTIANPGEFAAGVDKIKEFLTVGHDSVYVTMPNNIPVTQEVAGIIDQKIITVDKVVWLGGGAFVPLMANQEIYGNLYENLPVGMNGDMRFYVPGKNDEHRIKYFINNGLINTDTISTSRFPTGLRAQKEIYVNTTNAVDAGNFSGYERSNDPAKHIPVIVQDGKQLVLENATVDILDRFQTNAVRKFYNFGYIGNDEYLSTGPGTWLNENFGPNGPLQLENPNNQYGYDYSNPIIKSMRIGKNDIIHEAGHGANGKDTSNGVLNMLEYSQLRGRPIEFIIDGSHINIGWQQFPARQFLPHGPELNKGSPCSWAFLEFVSKDLFRLKEYGVTITVTEDWCIMYPSTVTAFNYGGMNGISGTGPQPSPLAKDYMMEELNIILDHDLNKPNIYPIKYFLAAMMRTPGGWGYNIWER